MWAHCVETVVKGLGEAAPAHRDYFEALLSDVGTLQICIFFHSTADLNAGLHNCSWAAKAKPSAFGPRFQCPVASSAEPEMDRMKRMLVVFLAMVAGGAAATL